MNTNTLYLYPKVSEIFSDVLSFDEDEILREGSPVNDSGAKSIDFLDLVCQLERVEQSASS